MSLTTFSTAYLMKSSLQASLQTFLLKILSAKRQLPYWLSIPYPSLHNSSVNDIFCKEQNAENQTVNENKISVVLCKPLNHVNHYE